MMETANEVTQEVRDEKDHASPKPHSIFYLSNRSVVFQVEDTLFKVDAAVFTDGQDSALKTMLTLPQGSGTDSFTPITLHGDTPAQFEMLLWGLYSQNLFQVHVAEADICRYVDITKIAHKYDFRELEAWAMSGLVRLSQDNPAIRSSQAPLLLEIFSLCNCTDARKLMLESIFKDLRMGSCSTASIAAFIALGRRFDLPGLSNRAYYAMMLTTRSEWENEATFSRNDRHRLLNGYYTLSQYSLDTTIEVLGTEFERYNQTWKEAWCPYATASKEEEIRKANGLKTADVVGRLRHLLDAFLKATPPAGIPISDIREDTQPGPTFRGILDRITEGMFTDEFSTCFADLKDV
ncbi:hypothetical protein K439DRAFT_1621765 [Ramaria rubella]|nr:hypothetical protein K439DRAFT_1621765 [Ramaria rubella]